MGAARHSITSLRRSRALVTGAVLMMLSACAAYHGKPLPTGGNLARVSPAGIAPLDMNRVATLAVLNNPDLNSARAAFGVARAQAFAAGLLPDPHFNLTGDHPGDNVHPGDPRYPEYNEYGLELDVDLLSLLAHPAVKASTRFDYQQAQLNLLWQEWQTVAQARTLYVAQSIASQRSTFLASAQRVYALAAQRSQRAQLARNVTLEQSSADLAVLQNVNSLLGDAQRSLLAAQQGLRSLIGVGPEVRLPLQPLAAPEIPSRAAVQSAVAQLPERRPDLRALQAGYRAQEARVRVAVLSQFPDVVVGFTKSRDNSDVHALGGLVNLTLPLFNRGRGELATQSATRAQLRADYQARLDQAVGAVWQLWREMRQLQGQLDTLQQQLPRLQSSVDAAERAYQAAEFPAASYLTLVGSYLAAKELREGLMQSLWNDSIALATVLGTQVQPQLPSPQMRPMDPRTPSPTQPSSTAASRSAALQPVLAHTPPAAAGGS
ncbi:MAG: TolC family protein [Steroidobacteraceae bacterium]